MWWHIPIILACGIEKQEGQEFKASLAYLRHCVKKQKQNNYD